MKRISAGLGWLACLVMSLVAFAVSAQDQAERPELVKGDRWTYTTRAETFVERDGDRLVFDVEGEGKASKAFRELTLTAIPDQGAFDPPYRSLKFPLRVGEKWSHSYTFDGVKRNARYEIVKRMPLSVQGKTYDSFKIEGHDQREDRPRGMYIEVYYSPQVRGIVKVYRRDDTPDAIKRQDYELVRFDPGG
jgi:hypothetical protein